MENTANNFINENLKGVNLLLTIFTLGIIALGYTEVIDSSLTMLLILPVGIYSFYKVWKAS